MAIDTLTSATQRRVVRIVEQQLGIKLIGIVPVRGRETDVRWFARSDENADYESDDRLTDVLRFGVIRGLTVTSNREIFINDIGPSW